MNLDSACWDQLLAECITAPGVPDRHAMIADAPFTWAEWATGEWSAEQAFQRLGITLLDWPEETPRDMVLGFATRLGIGLNSRARNKPRTVGHELAHVLLGHVKEMSPAAAARSLLRTPIDEFEADCTALLVCFALGQNITELSECRAYVQMVTQAAVPVDLPTDWSHIKAAAQRILAAGVSTGHQFGASIRPEPRPTRKVLNHLGAFQARIKWTDR